MVSCVSLLTDGLAGFGGQYELSQQSLAGLEDYFAELLKWRQRVNLVSKSASGQEIIEKHFLDSLSLLAELDSTSHLLDIGTGAGFPGLVCRVALPQMRLSLVEPRIKRVNFLRHIVRTLGLSKSGGEISIHVSRMEPGTPLCREKFTHITCRAVAEISPFIEMIACFSGSGAELLLMKGPRWEQELKAAQPMLHQYGYRLKNVREATLPFSGVKRFLLNFAEME